MSNVLSRLKLAGLNEQHIDSLKVLGVCESTTLDYKRELKLETTGDKKEFCKDVSAMANTHGGHLIFGVAEEEGVPSEILGIDFSDERMNQFFQVLTSGISPTLQSVDYGLADLTNGKKALVLRVCKDGKLHQVKYEDNRYYKRVGTITVQMESTDIESFFSQGRGKDRTGAIAESAKVFFDTVKSGKYFRGVDGEAMLALFVAPEVLSVTIDVGAIRDQFSTLFHPMQAGSWGVEATGRSRYAYATIDTAGPPYSVTELNQNGELRAFCTPLLSNRREQSQMPGGAAGFVPSVSFCQLLFATLHQYLNGLVEVEVVAPLYVHVALLNVKGYYLGVDRMIEWEGGRIYQEEDLIPDPVKFSQKSDYASPESVRGHLKPLLDFVWREFGFEVCSYARARER